MLRILFNGVHPALLTITATWLRVLTPALLRYGLARGGAKPLQTATTAVFLQLIQSAQVADRYQLSRPPAAVHCRRQSLGAREWKVGGWAPSARFYGHLL